MKIWQGFNFVNCFNKTIPVSKGRKKFERILGDTDVFRIYIPDPNIFAITMNGTDLIGSGDDTELWVMDALGNWVFNDDDSGPQWLSQVNAGALAGQTAWHLSCRLQSIQHHPDEHANYIRLSDGRLTILLHKPAPCSSISPARSSCRRQPPRTRRRFPNRAVCCFSVWGSSDSPRAS